MPGNRSCSCRWGPCPSPTPRLACPFYLFIYFPFFPRRHATVYQSPYATVAYPDVPPLQRWHKATDTPSQGCHGGGEREGREDGMGARRTSGPHRPRADSACWPFRDIPSATSLILVQDNGHDGEYRREPPQSFTRGSHGLPCHASSGVRQLLPPLGLACAARGGRRRCARSTGAWPCVQGDVPTAR